MNRRLTLNRTVPCLAMTLLLAVGAVSGSTRDLRVSLGGAIYVAPAEGISAKEVYVRQLGQSAAVVPASIAGKVLAVKPMLDDLADRDFAGLQKTLREVARAAVLAKGVNAAGELAEKGLATLGSAAVETVAAPLTAGISAVNAAAGRVADMITSLNLDTAEARFYIGIALVGFAQKQIATYLASREGLLVRLSSGRVLPYGEVASTMALYRSPRS
jgi:hypothetical protein